MLTEDYCSYEVAKLLKEKGFPMGEHLYMYVNKDGKLMTDHQACLAMTNEEYRTFFDDYIPTVTQALAMKWLREEHKLHIEISVDINDKHCFYASIYYNGEECWEEKEYYPNGVATYEEAVEAALKYCLTKLI